MYVLIIAEYEPTTDWVQAVLKDENYTVVGLVKSVSQAMQKIQQTPVDMILADSSGHGVLETAWIQSLAVQSTGIAVMVIATNSEMEFIRQAMLAGAQGFLLKPFGLAELHKSIHQVHQLSLQRKAALAEVSSSSELAPHADSKAHSIAVFGPKGGTGATTLAVNLAVALREQTGAPVLLVDADLRTADVDIFLNLLGRSSIYDLIDLDHELDPELLESVATRHASDVMVIRSEPRLQLELPVDPGRMNLLVEELISIWNGYIVINTASGLDRWTVEILDAVDTVLVVTTPELPALRTTRSFLDLADAAADPSGKWQLIMTSYQGAKVLRTADIEASIHYPIKATIAEDTVLVPASINRGLPLITSHRKSPIAMDILALARQVAKAKPIPPQPQLAASKPPVSKQASSRESRSSGRRFFSWRSRDDKVSQPAG